MLEGVIFDMDGVIVDTEPHSDEHMKSLLGAKGFTITNAHLDKLRGRNNRDSCTSILEEFPLQIPLEQLMDEVSTGYLNYLKALPNIDPIPGVRELIGDLLGVGIKLALASSASSRRIDFLLSKLKMDQHFNIRASGYEVKNGKPEPEIFLLAAKRIAIPTANCLVVEDSTNGVIAAKRAGMKCVGFAGSPHSIQDLSAADLIIKDFGEINPQILKQLF